MVCSYEAVASNVLIFSAILQYKHGGAEMQPTAGIHHNLKITVFKTCQSARIPDNLIQFNSIPFHFIFKNNLTYTTILRSETSISATPVTALLNGLL